MNPQEKYFSNEIIRSTLGILERHGDKARFEELKKDVEASLPQLLKKSEWHSASENVAFFGLLERYFSHWADLYDRISELLFREKQQNLFTSTIGLCLSPRFVFSKLPQFTRQMNRFNHYEVEIIPINRPGIGKARIVQKYTSTSDPFLNRVLSRSSRGSIVGTLLFLGCKPLKITELASVEKGDPYDALEVTWLEKESFKSFFAGVFASIVVTSVFWIFSATPPIQMGLTIGLAFLAGWAIHRNYHLRRSTQLAWEYQESLIRDHHATNSDLFDTQKQILYAQSKLNEMQSLSSLGALSYGLVHDMASPLMLLTSYTHALENRIKTNASPETIAEVTKRIQSAVAQLIRLQDLMRKVARNNNRSSASFASTTLKTIEIASFTKQLLALYEFFFHQHGIKHQLEFIGEPTELLLPEGVAESTLINLIQNSVNILVNRNGPRTISIQINFLDPKILRVEFEDNAGGIPQEVLDRIDSNFGSSKTSGGTGFGLGQIKRNIELADGKLEIIPTADGTRFYFSFPRDLDTRQRREEPA